MERLQKALAHAGVASRRACETMIVAGRVTVNGQVVRELGTQVDPDTDILAVDGHAVAALPLHAYILLNKPAGYVSTTKDPQGRPTVLDLLKETGARRLYPVGRLDVDSEGLLLLTDDGSLTERLTHPRYGLEKEYLVWVTGRPPASALAALLAGLPLDGKPARVDRIEIVEAAERAAQVTLLRVVIHEGRKREIRRLLELAGYPVRRLARVRLGSIELGDLRPGHSRVLTKQEIASLQALTGLPASASAPALAGAEKKATAGRRAPVRSPFRRLHGNQDKRAIDHNH